MNQPSSRSHSLPDSHQSVWQLAAIQMAGWTSLPILATSIAVLQKNSFLGAALTIFVGNTILWLSDWELLQWGTKNDKVH